MKSVGLEGVRNTAKNMVGFIKEKWLLFGLAFVLVVGFLLGFRITYAPELENSWNAISAVAAWVSAGGTIAAAWAAVQIPKKIAEQQNKIALLKSRLEIVDKINEISMDILKIHGLKNCVFDLDKNTLLKVLSFAASGEFIKNRNIIIKYNLYFPEHNECVKIWMKLYQNIALKYVDLELARDKNIVLENLLKSISKANEFIESDQFNQFKSYLREILCLK